MSVLLRLPFTIVMLVVLIAVGIYGRSHLGSLDEAMRHKAGYSMRLMVEGEIHRVLTSLFFTAGGWQFYSSIAMLAGAVGYAEWTQGTLRSTGTFLTVHIATLATTTAAVKLWSVVGETHRGNLLWEVRDVGPSAGYYGCLGLVVASLAPQLRMPIAICVLAVLAARVTWSFVHRPEDGRMLSSDIAHLFAFPLGISSFLALPRSC